MSVKLDSSGHHVVAALVILMIAMGLDYQAVNPYLRFDRAAIDAGEWWRLITCNIVHLGYYHLALNLCGLLLLHYFFHDVMSLRVWLTALLIEFAGVGLVLYWFNPDLYRYVGISGALHGFFIVALVLSFRQTPVLNGLIIALVIGRLTWEQLPGYDVNYLQRHIHGSVLVDAHLYGAIFGLLTALLFKPWDNRWAREEVSAVSNA